MQHMPTLTPPPRAPAARHASYSAATATASAATAPPTLRPILSAAPDAVAAAELELALVEAVVVAELEVLAALEDEV